MLGLPGALPDPGPYHAVPAAQRQGAPVDAGERGACDGSPAPRLGLLRAPSRLLPGGHRHAAALLAPQRGVRGPQEPQICHAAPVGDVRVKATNKKKDKQKNSNQLLMPLTHLTPVDVPTHCSKEEKKKHFFPKAPFFC